MTGIEQPEYQAQDQTLADDTEPTQEGTLGSEISGGSILGQSSGDTEGSSGEGSGGDSSGGDALGSGNADGSSGDAAGLTGDANPPATIPVVDPVTGQTIGTATYNPQTGQYDSNVVETTVVQEYPPQPSSQPVTTADSVTTPALSGGGGGGGSAPAAGTVNWAADPSFFKFQTHPDVWYTACLELGLVYLYKGKPITTPIMIRFRVEVPRRANGQEVTLRQAQLAAAGAATASAARVSEALSLYMYPASEGPTQFRTTMELELQPAYGGTVRGC